MKLRIVRKNYGDTNENCWKEKDGGDFGGFLQLQIFVPDIYDFAEKWEPIPIVEEE